MSARYVWRELWRNPRRTLASLVGVALGVGLFSAVLFFIDGSGASMTRRALAPLALDQQRVLASPFGGRLSLREQVGAAAAGLRQGEVAAVSLTVSNTSSAPANEVVLSDLPAAPLRYVPGSTRLAGRALADVQGESPLAQGPAQTGFNLGSLAPGRSVQITFRVRAEAPLAPAAARPRGTISSRESVIPIAANAPPPASLDALAATVGRLPGVASADGLSFVDLPRGSLASGRTSLGDVRLFAFDERYRRQYPSIRIVGGALSPGRAVLSVEAARALGARSGSSSVALRLPGRRDPLMLPVGGVADLSRAKPLFYSRKSTNLEDFLYVPNGVVVDPATFRDLVLPAYRAATAARGSALLSSPLLELDVRLDRASLRSDPAGALRQSQAVGRAVTAISPGQDYLIDNASNTLQVARDDAAVAKRMFLFLGLPGALLAAFLAGFAGSVLAGAQRREQATLRLRGAHRGDLLRMLVLRSALLAGAGSVLGTAAGFVSALIVLGPAAVGEAAAATLLVSALLAVALGVLTTALALYLPGRRALRNEIAQERGELAPTALPAWRRKRLDLVLLAAALVGEAALLSSGAFSAPTGSVYQGQAVSLPSRLLTAPVLAWIAGTLVVVRVLQAIMTRLPLPAPPRFGALVPGALLRSVRRRSWSLAAAIVCVGLVIGFGTALATFTATYDASKAADARYLLGADVRVTPSVLSLGAHPPSFARALEVPGIAAATAVVFSVENAVLTGPYSEDRQNLAAVDPAGFLRVASPPDRFFVGSSAAAALHALQADPRGILVEARAADALQLKPGDDAPVLLARGTPAQRRVTMHVVGLFHRLPGFPEGATLLTDLRTYERATGAARADVFLARSAMPGADGLRSAVDALRAGPGGGDRLNIESTATALGKDQSSLTALNVRGLVNLNGTYTLLMAAAGISIFVFGLVLERRREYVTLRAQGAGAGQVRALVLGETAVVGMSALLAGVLVGLGMGALLVRVLRSLFVLPPSTLVPGARLAALIGLALVATLVSSLAASALLRRLRATELLRET